MIRRPDIPDEIEEKLKVQGQRLRKNTLAFRREVVDKMSSLATAAFGLVAALAWNNAIQAIFAQYYPPPGTTAPPPASIGPLLLYAVVITLIAVLVIIWIGRFAGRLKEQAEAEAEGKSKAAAGA